MCKREEKDTRDQRKYTLKKDVGKMEGKGIVLESTIEECER